MSQTVALSKNEAECLYVELTGCNNAREEKPSGRIIPCLLWLDEEESSLRML